MTSLVPMNRWSLYRGGHYERFGLLHFEMKLNQTGLDKIAVKSV